MSRAPHTALAFALSASLAVLAAGCGASSGDDGGASGPVVDPAALPGKVVDLATAQSFFPALKKPNGRMMWDAQAWVVLRPDRNQSFAWPEHPDGRITFRTNNRGFREDRPTEVAKQGLRILVTGDSQTEGAVNNAESWPHALERLLDADDATSADAGAPRREPAEVLNAGVGGTGPHNHLGVLRKNLDLQPDVFIAALFTGNDFHGALEISDFLGKRHPRPRTAEYIARLDSANARWPDQLPQEFNQAAYFAFAPEDEALALNAAVGVYEEMAAVCREHGIRFVAVVIPTKPDVEPGDDAFTVDSILKALGLSRDQLRINARLGRDFAAALQQRGITCIDALDGLRGADVNLYWRKDHHLDIAGNERLAHIVHEQLAPLLR